MNVLRLSAAIAVAIATCFLIAVQLVPFAGIHESAGGANVKADAYVWEAKYSASFGGESQSDSKGWYDNDFDDENGAGKVRTAAIFLVAGLALYVLGTALQFLLAGPVGPLATLGGLALTLVGMILLSVGVGDLFDDEQDWFVGFYFTIVALALGLAGAVLGLLPARLVAGVKSRGGPSF